MATKLTIATESDVKTVIASLRTWFSIDASDSTRISYSTRDHGNVGAETHGQTDFDEAVRIRRELESRFSNVRVNVDANDEWVNLDINIHSKPLPPRPPSKKDMHDAIKNCQMESRIKHHLQATGVWKERSVIYAPSTGAPELIFNPDPREEMVGSICFCFAIHGDVKEWTLYLVAGEKSVVLESLAEIHIEDALDRLSKLTDGFYATKELRYLIGRKNLFGSIEYLMNKTLKDDWTTDPDRAKQFQEWEIRSFNKQRLANLNASLFSIHKGRKTVITPQTHPLV